MIKPILHALMVTAVLASTAFVTTVQAAPRNQHAPASRVYDRAHRDYHTWNANEDRAYRGYLSSQHRPYRSFSRSSRSQQQDYWRWRHNGR
jgi:hypothetical protein